MDNFRKEAEEHWKFIEKILQEFPENSDIPLNLVRFLYVEAMVHGYKHAKTGATGE